MMIKYPKKTKLARISPLFLLSLSVVLLFSLCFASIAAYAINDTNNHEESSTVTECKKNDNDKVFLCVEGSQETATSVFVDSDKLIPEEPPIQEGESQSKIIEAELEDKTGLPEIFDDGIFRYYLIDGAYYEVAGIYKFCFDKIEIPSELFGVPVKGIQSYAFRNYVYLVSVVIPESVEYIGDYAFYNCSNLTSITLPKGEIQIGEGAFQMSE